MFKPLALFISLRYTNFRDRDHFITFISYVSMIGIALGVMVLITVLSVMNGFSAEMKTRMLNVTPHVTVYGPNQALAQRSFLQELASLPGVLAIGPYLDAQGMLAHASLTQGVMIKGIDVDKVDAIFPLKETLIQGNLTALRPDKFGIILGKGLAQSLQVEVGDNVLLLVPSATISLAGMAPRLKRFEVVGIFEVGYLFDNNLAFVNLQDALKIFKKDRSGLQLKLIDPFLAPQLRHTIQAHTSPAFDISDWTLTNSHYFEAMKMEKTMMFFTLLMILAIAIFNLLSTMVMIVTDKHADIAILRTLGASKGMIMAIFIGQGAIIGCVGTILGMVSGIILSLNVTKIVSFIEQLLHIKFLSSDVYYISFLPARLLASDVALVVLCSLLLSLLATLHPAWRAIKIQPATALRHE